MTQAPQQPQQPFQQQYAQLGWQHPQPNRDEEHLKLLWIFHYVLGGMVGLFSFFPLIYVFLGLMFLSGSMQSSGNNPPPPEMGWVFIIMGSVFFLLGMALATIILIAAGRLRKKRNWTFCFVTACASCLLMPFGTALGVLTILVLNRDTVKAAFMQQRRQEAVV